MGVPLRVLLVEDSADDALLTARELRRQGYEPTVDCVEDGVGLLRALEGGPWDVVISDWSLPKFDALAALSAVRSRDPDVPFLIVSGTIGEETAVEALRAGAADFLVKGNLGRIGRVIRRELDERALRVARRDAEEKLRKTEEQLRHAQRMEAVGRLAGGIAHDFNNVLAVILTYAELVSMRHPANEPLRQDVGEILAAARHAADLTRQLLAFSRRQVLEPMVIDLNELLFRLQGMVKQALGAGVTLSAHAATSLWNIKADQNQIAQVVMNLVINARDAMPRGGAITISTENAVVESRLEESSGGLVPGEYVKLSIADTGTGMPPEVLAEIWEPFFTTKERGKGTGLGLSTVYGIVRQSGGSITVTSEPGQGSVFDVFFPRVMDVAGHHPSTRASEDVSHGTETVLIVEDDERVRAAACSVLRGDGYTTLESANAGEALVVFEEHGGRIDLLLSDVALPRMGGRELAARLQAKQRDLKVLFMSGYLDDEGRHALLAGFPFLQKSFTVSSLRRKVREVLGRVERRSPVPDP